MRMQAFMDCTRRSYKIGLRNRKGTVTIAIADRDRSRSRNEINALCDCERTTLRPGLGAA